MFAVGVQWAHPHWCLAVMYLVAEHKTKKTLKAEYGLGAEPPEEVLRNEMDKWIASFPSKQV